MGTFKIKTHDGEYQAEADSVEQAIKDVNAFRQDELQKRQAQTVESSPPWAKPFYAAQDVGRVGINAVGLGIPDFLSDKFSGTDEQRMLTEAAKRRMGWAGTAAEGAALVGALPTAVPKVVGMVGGGPAVRTLTGAVTGGTEGALAGGVTAATHDQSVPEGAGIGGATGVLGPLAGSIANKGVQKFNELFRGQTYAAPTYNVTKLGTNPDPMRRVNVATTKGEQEAARFPVSPSKQQSAIKSEFADLQSKNIKGFSKAEKEALDKIVKGDPGTIGAEVIGKYLSDKIVTTGAGGLAGVSSGGVLPGLMAAAGTGLAGFGAKKAALAGTRESVQDLRRLLYGVDKFKGPISDTAKGKLAAAARQLGIDYNDPMWQE